MDQFSLVDYAIDQNTCTWLAGLLREIMEQSSDQCGPRDWHPWSEQSNVYL